MLFEWSNAGKSKSTGDMKQRRVIVTDWEEHEQRYRFSSFSHG